MSDIKESFKIIRNAYDDLYSREYVLIKFAQKSMIRPNTYLDIMGIVSDVSQYDHNHGLFIYRDNFPDIKIIGVDVE